MQIVEVPSTCLFFRILLLLNLFHKKGAFTCVNAPFYRQSERVRMHPLFTM